jgi:hypothetical protein
MKQLVPVLLVLFLAVFACKKSEPPAPAPATPAPAATTSNAAGEAPITSTESAVAPEVNPPGDIPDSQAFVKYHSAAGGYELDVPEGWARTENGPDVTFVDKLDGVSVTVTPASAPPTTASASSAAKGRAVQVTDTKEVTLPAGKAIVVRYSANSDPNPVTNKQVRLDEEAYLFYRNGKLATLTLWAPKGADNVDQWQRMAKSFRWL